MRIPIVTKLFVSLFITSVALVASMAFLVSHSFKSGFQDYLNQQEKKQVIEYAATLSNYYSPATGWQEVIARPAIWRGVLENQNDPFPRLEPKRFAPYLEGRRDEQEALLPPHRKAELAQELRPLSHRIHLEDAQRRWIIGAPQVHDQVTFEWLEEPIKVGTKTVGWLVL